MTDLPPDFKLLRFEHKQPGLHTLGHLPQRESVEHISIGTGWWELDKLLALYPGQFVVISGDPGSGKSTFIFNLLVNVAKRYGTRSFLFVPENEAHLREKFQRIWGDDKGFDYFCNHQCLIQSAVPAQNYEPPLITLDWLLQQAVVAIEKNGVSTLIIDPWNELEWARKRDQSMTDYIGECLRALKAFLRAHSVTAIMIVHPTKARIRKDNRATLYDCEGSAHWVNKCDNGLIVERTDKATIIHSDKVRERGAGREGVCYFSVDAETERFTPQMGAVG